MGSARLLFLWVINQYITSMLAEDTIEVKILQLLAPSIENMGYEVVRVRMQGSGSAKALQVMIDRTDGKMIGVEDCEKVSKHISALLDVEDPIDTSYNLEVSSPGVDRPLTRLKDFIRYAGFEIKLEANSKIDGQAKFRGNLVGLENENIVMDLNIIDITNPGMPKRVKIPFSNLRNAKLVLTDELMAAFANSELNN